MVPTKQAVGRGIWARHQAIIREGGERERAAVSVCFSTSTTARDLFLKETINMAWTVFYASGRTREGLTEQEAIIMCQGVAALGETHVTASPSAEFCSPCWASAKWHIHHREMGR